MVLIFGSNLSKVKAQHAILLRDLNLDVFAANDADYKCLLGR